MTRSDLIAKLAERYPQLLTRDAELAVKVILDAMSAALARAFRHMKDLLCVIISFKKV